MLITTIACLLAYCLGSVSSAIIVCRLAGLPDPRTAGSKNPGATNVLRMGSKKIAAITLLGDILKGVIPVVIAIHINPSPTFVGPVMVSVFLGHLYPVFFKFQGGKGVATAIGTIFALGWSLGLLCVGTWGIVVWRSRFSSLGALVSAILAPIYVGFFLSFKFAIAVVVMSVFLFWRHRGNIRRLIKGTEPKIGN
jgi:acyl phosphate:glycerol-3-phosphate acyltransferase